MTILSSMPLIQKRKTEGTEEQTDLITDFEWCCVLIVSGILQLLVSQVCIIHSSTGNALKGIHKFQQYYT
jgi:hypothetical protein